MEVFYTHETDLAISFQEGSAHLGELECFALNLAMRAPGP